MKNFILACLLVFGLNAKAQYSYNGNFEDPNYSAVIYKQFGGGSRTTSAACTGANGGQLMISDAIPQTGFMVDLNTISQSGNGQQIDVSVSYKKSSALTGYLSLAYFEFDTETGLWSVIPFGTELDLVADAITTCASLTGNIPSGILQPGKIYGIGVWFEKSGTNNGSISVDDIIINQDASVVNPPSCTTIINPVAGTSVSAGNLKVSWNNEPTAVNYKLKVGTTAGSSNVINTTIVGTNTDIALSPNTTYYLQVIPSNLNGDASGCTAISFTTNNTINYCGPINSTAPNATYPISSVNLGGITKTSSAVVGSPAYEDFTGTVITLNQGLTYPLKVTGKGAGTNRFGMTVFIDWNNDGDFNDANERYFTTEPFVQGAAATNNLTGSVKVPENTAVGNKRMRIKYNFNNSTTALVDALADPCSDVGNGQVEDYTLSITAPTVVPVCTAFTNPLNNATNVPANANFTWTAVTNASGYKLYVGTSAGVYDILNGTTVSTNNYQSILPVNTTLYAKVVPYNLAGSASGCTEITFTTGNLVYCGPLTYGAVEPITNVTFAGINNTTSATIDGTPSHEYFLDKVGTVLTGTDYPVSLNANTDGGTFRHFFAVFIDWNQNGDFNDAGEKYFTTPENFIFVLGSDGFGTPATGTISVPEDAKMGQTRMRVKSSFYGANGPQFNPDLAFFANACSTEEADYGQIEDYTLNVNSATAGTSGVTKNAISIYPNPFHDVLKISDVEGVQSISISDVSGRLVKTMKATAELNLSNLNTGLYIVTLHMKDGTVKSIKAIKK